MALLVLVAASLTTGVLSDPDTLWHIAAGRWMVEHRELPMQDMFSWTMPGTPWTAHEWLAELLLYAVWSIGGFPAVVALSAGSFALTSVVVTRFLAARLEPQQLLPVALLVLGILSTHYLARPHVLAWPLLGLWIGTLVEAVDARRPPPRWLLIMLVLWANLHASFTLALGISAGLALDALLLAPSAAKRWDVVRQWGGFGAGALVACAINPNGLGTLLHAVQMMRMQEMLALINEWQSANFHEFQIVLLWMVMVFGLALTGRLRLSPVRMLLVLGLFYMALKHGRYHSILALGSIFFLAAPLAEALRFRGAADAPTAQTRTLDAVMARLHRPTHPMAIIGALVLAGGWLTLATPLLPAGPPDRIAPARALAAYQASNPASHRLLNGYGFGGYLIFRRVPVSIDGRADMYGDPFLRELADAVTLKAPHALERYLERYRIDGTLLAPNTPAVELLDHLPGWQRLYGDSVAVVHVRRADQRARSR